MTPIFGNGVSERHRDAYPECVCSREVFAASMLPSSFFLHAGWAVPKYGNTAWVLASYHNNRGLLAAALFVSSIASLLCSR